MWTGLIAHFLEVHSSLVKPNRHPRGIFIFVYRALLHLQVGTWNESGQIEMFKNEIPVWSSGSTEIPLDIPNILKGKTLTIATIEVRFMTITQ